MENQKQKFNTVNNDMRTPEVYEDIVGDFFEWRFKTKAVEF